MAVRGQIRLRGLTALIGIAYGVRIGVLDSTASDRDKLIAWLTAATFVLIGWL